MWLGDLFKYNLCDIRNVMKPFAHALFMTDDFSQLLQDWEGLSVSGRILSISIDRIMFCSDDNQCEWFIFLSFAFYIFVSVLNPS